MPHAHFIASRHSKHVQMFKPACALKVQPEYA
jgi:hypothetical protein